ncbi:MAG: ATP-binding cassette domain-containing protein, partial [Thermodesulfobacteriota bacterium]|nr:ATP-binding cassette domain-containing protein [Thermodesulfobacteriota bacterium]
MPVIEARRLGKIYGDDQDNSTVALNNFNLSVEEKEFVTIVGSSGCGKSTFLLLVAGLEPITSGELLLDGLPVDGPDPNHAIVFQEYFLFPWRTVWENVEFGPEVRGFSRQRTKE